MVEDQTSFIHAPPLHQPLFSAILMTNNTDNITLLDVRQFTTLECIKKTRIMVVLLDTESSNEIV